MIKVILKQVRTYTSNLLIWYSVCRDIFNKLSLHPLGFNVCKKKKYSLERGEIHHTICQGKCGFFQREIILIKVQPSICIPQ